MERLFSVSKEWFRSWPHAFLITYDKTLTEKLLAVHPEKVAQRKKRKKQTRKAIAKLFALNTNAISDTLSFCKMFDIAWCDKYALSVCAYSNLWIA